VERRAVPALAPQVGRGREAGSFRHPHRHELEAELLVLLPVPVRGELGQPAKALRALAQRLLGPAALGDVLVGRDLVVLLAGGAASEWRLAVMSAIVETMP